MKRLFAVILCLLAASLSALCGCDAASSAVSDPERPGPEYTVLPTGSVKQLDGLTYVGVGALAAALELETGHNADGNFVFTPDARE